MTYDFDEEWFKNLIAEQIKLGYTIPIAVLLSIMHYPPMVNAILEGIQLGGKRETTHSRPKTD